MQSQPVNFETVKLSLWPPLRYLGATLICGNLFLYPVIYYSQISYSHPEQFWLLLFLLNLLIIPSVSLGFAITFQVHKHYAYRIAKELNLKLQSAADIKIATVFPYTAIARIGLTAVRKATDSEAGTFSVICFQRTDENFLAYLWPLPSLVSRFNMRKQMYIAVPLESAEKAAVFAGKLK